jgi:hypothetical protein
MTGNGGSTPSKMRSQTLTESNPSASVVPMHAVEIGRVGPIGINRTKCRDARFGDRRRVGEFG